MSATPPPAAPAASRRLDFVDLLRGLACVWVVLYHEFQRTQAPDTLSHLPQRAFLGMAHLGFAGVNMFLVLSGFCLFYPLVRKTLPGTPLRLAVKTYAGRRAKRILPPYYAALVILLALAWSPRHFHLGPVPDAANVAAHVFMVYNLHADWYGAVNPAFWSLALEAQLYVLFPLLVWIFNRFGLRTLVVGVFAVSCLWEVWAWARIVPGETWTQTGVWAYALPGRAFEFVAGMAAAFYVARPAPQQTRRALFAGACVALPTLWGSVQPVLGLLINPLWGVVFACMVVALSEANPARFTQNRLLGLGVWVGAFSYSIYLVHQPTLAFVPAPFLLSALHLPHSSSIFVLNGVRLLLIGLVGYAFHRVFERPFMPGQPKTERQTETAAAVSPAP